MFFDNAHGVWRALVIGVAAYALLVLAVRVGGKRTLSKMNAFDLIVTVALGSTLATVALSSDVSLAEGATAFGVLVAAQFAVAWSSVRVAGVRRVVKARPVLLVDRGRIRADVCRRERLTEGEVRQAVRASGVGGLHQVAAVVLETDGSLSVITDGKLGDADALADVDGADLRPRP
ncbi:MAG: DUF421 domain-containing protein [Acidimicrobiales bacterium]